MAVPSRWERTTPSPPPSRSAMVSGAAAVVLGASVLAGWAWDIPLLTSVLPGLFAMKANAAVCLVLAGTSLWLIAGTGTGAARQRLGRLTAALMGLLALATLSQDLGGWDLGMDQLLVREPAGALFTAHLGRMSTLAAINYLLVAVALLAAASRRAAPAVQAVALLVGLAAVAVVGGYLFGARSFPSFGFFTPMAMWAALGFVVLALGLLAATADAGFLARVRARLPAFGFGFAVLVLAVAGIASVLNTRRMIETSGWVEHTHHVFERLESVMANLQEVGAGVRGFAATGQEEFLAPVAEAREALARDVSELGQLTAGNSAQQERLAGLRPLIQARLAHADESVRLCREQGTAQATALITGGEGERLVKEIRGRVREMERTEHELLARRRADAAASNANTFLGFGLTGCVSLAILVALFAAVRRLNRGLEARVGERTAELQRSNRALRTLSECNQALARAQSERELLNEVCRILVEHGGYRTCFVGYAEQNEAKTIRPVAWAGGEPETNGLTWAETERGRNAAGAAIRSGQPVVINDLMAAALPLKVNSTTLGALTVAATEADDAFNAAEMALLSELANDLCFGIGSLRTRAARQQAEDAGRKANEYLTMVLESISDGFFAMDEHLVVTYFNRAAEKLLGRSSHELLGRNLFQAFPEAKGSVFEEKYTWAVREKQSVVFETYFDVPPYANWYDVRVYPAADGITVFFQLVTERKRAEEEIRRLNADLERRVAQRTTQLEAAGSHLRDSERRFRQVVESLPQLVWTCRADGPCDYLSLQWIRYTGIPEAPQLGYGWLEQLHPEDRERTVALWQATAARGDNFAIEFRIRRHDGMYRWFRTLATPVRDEAGKIVKWFGSNTDITDRKEAEEEIRQFNESLEQRVRERTAELRASETKLRTITAAAKDAVILMNDEGNISFWNPAAEAMFGYPVAEVLGKDAHELIAPARYLESYRQGFLQWRHTGQGNAVGKTLELVGVRKGGPEFPIELSLASVKLEGRWVAVGVARDISERKRTEEEIRRLNADLERRVVERTAQLEAANTQLRASEEEFRSLAHELALRNRIVQVFLTVSHEGMYAEVLAIILEAMASQAGVFGYLSPDGDLIVPTMTREVWDKCQVADKRFVFPRSSWGNSSWPRAIREKRTIACNLPSTLTPAGHMPIARHVSLPLIDQGEVIGLIQVGNKESDYTAQDVGLLETLGRVIAPVLGSRLKREWQEEKRAQAEQALAHSNRRLQEANRELEAFSYSVSHDLSAPLRAIDGFSRFLQEDYGDQLDETGRDHLQEVRAGCQRMGAIIDDLLDLSRITRKDLTRQPVDLSELARAVATDLHRSQPERQAEFIIADGLLAVGDPSLLRVALSNLLGNAWKFTSQRPQARIEVGRVSGERLSVSGEQQGPAPGAGHVPLSSAVFFVRDNGAGFDMQYVHKLFGAFQRLHDVSEFEGTGIGLATVQRIISRHGGQIWAEGEVDVGATFYFTLPHEEER